jgi:ABC-type phosphate transport system permease subunit
MYHSATDHHQGAHLFLVKITELKMWIFIRGYVVMQQRGTMYHTATLLTANPPLQQNTVPHAVIGSLMLLMMGKCLSETCSADLEDQ